MDLVLADNSNIIIEIKKLVGPEGRFDYEKFIKNHINFENQKKILVGSTPPKSDAFWEAMRNQGWEVYTYERKTNGEKAVDTKIIAKGVSHVVQQEVPATLNLLSGDLDMLPLVEEALERNWNVTLWSWQDSLSKDYSNMDKVEVKHLDDIAENLIFFKMIDEDGYSYNEYFIERERRLEQEKKEHQFKRSKQNSKYKIENLIYLADKVTYLDAIDKITDLEQSLEIEKILSDAQDEDYRLKKKAEEKAIEEKRQQEAQENQAKEAKKQKRKEFWKHNWGWFAGGVSLAGAFAAVISIIKYDDDK